MHVKNFHLPDWDHTIQHVTFKIIEEFISHTQDSVQTL